MKKGQIAAGVLAGNSIVAILDNVRSSHNVGSMFRTADALGVGKLFLVGYTPAPRDQFGRVNAEIAKVALGAEDSVAWESIPSMLSLIKKLKKGKSSKKNGKNAVAQKYHIVAVEQHSTAIDYKKFKAPKISAKKSGSTKKSVHVPVAFIFGNEVDGVSEKTLKLCDEIVEIPMAGKKESLNVSVAFGIALARMLNR